MVPNTVCSISGVISRKNSAPSTWIPESVSMGEPKAAAIWLAIARPMDAG